MALNLVIALETVTFSHRVINGRKEKEPFDGIRPRPFNEVHEIHKPSQELGHLGYAVITKQCIIDVKKRVARDTATNYESVLLETDIYKPNTVGHV